MADYIYSMETRLTPDQQRGVNLVQEIARHAGLNLYLTGGTIRDLVTGFPIRDIDLSIQGNPLKLQKELEKAGISVEGVDEDLRTLHLLLPGNVRAELNMTRSETYDKPGKPPTITSATINEDLRRRDFTINAMALSLNPGSQGLLLDPFNGMADIEAKVLRILHNYAFLEDPIRLIRATRLSSEIPLAIRGAYPGALRRCQGKQLHRVCRQAVDRTRTGAVGARGRSHPRHAGVGKRRLAQSAASALDVAKVEASDWASVIKSRQMMNELGYCPETGPIAMYFLAKKLTRQGRLRDSAHDSASRLRGQMEAPGERRSRAGEKADRERSRITSGAWKVLSAAAPEDMFFLSMTTTAAGRDQKLKNFFDQVAPGPREIAIR